MLGQSAPQPHHADGYRAVVLPRALMRASGGYLVGASGSRHIYAAPESHDTEV